MTVKLLNLDAIFGDDDPVGPRLGSLVPPIAVEPPDANAVWNAALDQVEAEGLLPEAVLGACRSAGVRWGDSGQTAA